MQTSRRLAFVLEDWYLGGTEHYVAGLGRHLVRECNVEIDVIILRETNAAAMVSENDWCRETHFVGGSLPKRIKSIRGILEHRRFDVVHCHLYSSLLSTVGIARLQRKPRIVITLHMPARQWSMPHRLAWRLAVKLSDRVVGVSRDCLASLDLSLEPPLYSVIPLPLPDLSTLPERREVKKPDATFKICGSGRLAKEKDWPTLIRAFAALAKGSRRPLKLQLYGEGDQHEALTTLVEELGITTSVDFIGHVERDELLRQLCDADLFVLPSKFEGLGISAVEAMAIGVPTITADFPASLDYIQHGETGHRFPRGDWRALRNVMAWHLDRPLEALAIGDSGRDFVRQRFSVAETFAQYEAVYGDR